MQKRQTRIQKAAQALGRRGGRATLDKAGREHYSRIGREGVEKRWEEIRRAREVLSIRPPRSGTLGDMVRHALKVFIEEEIRLARRDQLLVIGAVVAPQFPGRDTEEIVAILKADFAAKKAGVEEG